jgi:lipoprotein-anchoring transpeptidase ErfK/SrfK
MHGPVSNRMLLAATAAVTFVIFAFAMQGLPASESQRVSFSGSAPASAEASQGAFVRAIFDAPRPPLFKYIEVIDSCGPHYEGICVNMRSGPGEEYPVVAKLRTGIVLKVANTVTRDGKEWYNIDFDSTLRYPERVESDWYVAADFVQLFTDEGDETATPGIAVSTDKRIIVDISEQTLYAYDGNILFMQESISTGLEFTPTPIGTFIIFKKTPSRYMQGPIPEVSDQYYDLPGVPWDLYFTHGGAVIHGAYWHDSFGEQWSHGCVNLPLQSAKKLYIWADVGTPVTVQK